MKRVHRLTTGKSKLGIKIRELRKAAGFTITQLATMAKISRPYISQIELGIVRNPSLEVLKGIATALKVTINELLEDSGQLSVSREVGPEEMQRLAIALAQNRELSHAHCIVTIDIAQNGDADITFNVIEWNFSNKVIYGDFWKLWFKCPVNEGDMDIRASDVNTSLPIDYKLETDLGQFKNLQLMFNLPPGGQIHYTYEYKAPGMFSPEYGLWWAQEIPRRCSLTSVDILMPRGYKINYAQVESLLENRKFSLNILDAQERQTVHWELKEPLLGNIYIISWKYEE